MATGYSLVELLLTIALLSVLLMVAVPGLRELRNNRVLRIQVNELVHAVHLAKHTALISGNTVTLCPSRTGRRCDYSAAWHEGWLLFSHTSTAPQPQVGNASEILLTHRLRAPIQITANRAAFSLRSYGRRSTNGTFMFCGPLGQSDARQLVISYTGKPRAERVAAADNRCTAT